MWILDVEGDDIGVCKIASYVSDCMRHHFLQTAHDIRAGTIWVNSLMDGSPCTLQNNIHLNMALDLGVHIHVFAPKKYLFREIICQNLQQLFQWHRLG